VHLQANASLAPNSWEQYVSAIIEYYNVTSGSTQLSNSTAAPGKDPSSSAQGLTGPRTSSALVARWQQEPGGVEH
jgi:hypothetical protein